MKAILNMNPALTIEVEGDTQEELYREVASVQEVFSERKCRLCGSENIRFACRKNNDEDLFYEIQCQGFIEVKQPDGKPRKERCRAYLALGLHKKGGHLFPIRKLTPAGKPDREKGNYGPHEGWTRYRGEPKDD